MQVLLKYFLLVLFAISFPVNAQEESNEHTFYDSALVVRSNCVLDPAGYCGTNASVYLWEERKGEPGDFSIRQIMHCIKNQAYEPFVILLGDADNKGIYAIEAEGIDAAGITVLNLVYLPYKGKESIYSLIPNNLYLYSPENLEALSDAIATVVNKQLKNIKKWSSFPKGKLELYDKFLDEYCEEYSKKHKHPGWVLKVYSQNHVITWDIGIAGVMCWCNFWWEKHVRKR